MNGERFKTTSMDIKPKSKSAPIDLYFINQVLSRKYTVVGKVVARSWLLEKGMEELKNQARELGADAVIDVKYERKFSVDYLQDLFDISGDAVIWNN